MGKGPEEIILQTGHTEGPETHERMLAIREMQIKTTRYHSTPVRMATITNQQTSAGEVVEKGNASALLVGMQTGAATLENTTKFPQKRKNGSAF